MAKSRSSKALLKQPETRSTYTEDAREAWLQSQVASFVCPTPANRLIYEVILRALWPQEHGIPGPILTETDIRAAVDGYRASLGEGPYKDVFRRMRELQGDEGLTSIDKEGVRYQLTSLEVGQKKPPRQRPKARLWREIKANYNYRCAHCGLQEPEVTLSPDHRVPRSRGGTNDLGNWQPLCGQCNTQKSSACQGCDQNCHVCSWARPETYKAIKINDDNKERVRRFADQKGVDQSTFVNEVLRDFFNRLR